MAFLSSALNLFYLSLQRPWELPVSLEDLAQQSGPRAILPAAVLAAALAGLSSGTALYYLRDFYDGAWLIQVLALCTVQTLLTLLWALLLGPFLDAVVRIRYPERAGKPWLAAAVLVFSALPNAFAIAGAVLGGFLPDPALVAAPVQLGLLIWSIIIAVKGLQYLYELNLRSAAGVYGFGLIVSLGLPALGFVWMTLRLIESAL